MTASQSCFTQCVVDEGCWDNEEEEEEEEEWVERTDLPMAETVP